MRRWIAVGAGLAGGVAAGMASAVSIGTLLWGRATARSVRRLATPAGSRRPARDGAGTSPFAREQLAGLPAPVARYFEFALTPGRPLIRRARLQQTGVMRSRAGAPWYSFTAAEHFSVAPPGFVWDASMRMAPFISVRIRDAYLGGEGISAATIAGLIGLGSQRGTPEVASASLVRYLAEAVWLPTALLPSEGVGWTAVDERTARATLSDGVTTVSLDVHFDERGEIVRVATTRYRDVDGVPVLTPWEGHFRDYAPIEGMMIPRTAEVAWALPEGPLSVWRGRIVAAEYEFAG
jgi:hypothetical protein